MQKTQRVEHETSSRARFVIFQTDVHLAGFCAEVRRSAVGMRSITVMAAAESILAQTQVTKPISLAEILELTGQQGMSVTTYMTKTSKRFPLLRQALADCEGYNARSIKLKKIIETHYLRAFERQLDRGAGNSASIQLQHPSPSAYSVTEGEASRLPGAEFTNYSFISSQPPRSIKEMSAQDELANALMGIAV
jgi:hypothetical protein